MQHAYVGAATESSAKANASLRELGCVYYAYLHVRGDEHILELRQFWWHGHLEPSRRISQLFTVLHKHTNSTSNGAQIVYFNSYVCTKHWYTRAVVATEEKSFAHLNTALRCLLQTQPCSPMLTCMHHAGWMACPCIQAMFLYHRQIYSACKLSNARYTDNRSTCPMLILPA